MAVLPAPLFLAVTVKVMGTPSLPARSGGVSAVRLLLGGSTVTVAVAVAAWEGLDPEAWH